MGGNGALRVHHVFSADLAVAADVLAQREVVEVEGQIDEILLGRVLQLCDADEELIILVIIETLHPLGEVVQFVQICEAVFQNGEFSFSAAILGYERQSDNAVSTFYTSCSQQYPNNYVTAQTNPAEMSWMAWYALAKGFDGYLRWAYDYWTQSDPTSAQDGSNASGDFNMIYRSENTAAAVPISSIRLELLREGIQDYEKARILNNGQLDAAIRNFTSASGREAAKWVGIAEGTLKELSAND